MKPRERVALACGTGRHLCPLGELGLDVHGAGISAEALQFAYRAAATRHVQPTLDHQAMEACDLPHHYGTIYVAYECFLMLERAGFEEIRTYADYTDAPATQESKTVVYGARRSHAACGGQAPRSR